MRVEPHILGLSGLELKERRRIREHRHPLTKIPWWAPSRLTDKEAHAKLDKLAPVYARSVASVFTASLGDPLEISIFKALMSLKKADVNITFLGAFDLTNRQNNGRFHKTEPPASYNGASLDGPPDFVLFNQRIGVPLMIECKNNREWLYPSSDHMKRIVRKALAADMTPVLVARQMPYITKRGLCQPAGILAHETYHQLYPETREGQELASAVRETRGLGYADVRASENTLPRTTDFFERILPTIAQSAARRFQKNREALEAWSNGDLAWKDLFNHLNKHGEAYSGFDGEMNL